MKRKRIDLIDALRGLALLLMVIHHFLYDLVAFCGAPSWLFTNPVFDVLHYIFAGVFILLSGVSSNFSRSNVARGIKTWLCALIITLVTWKMGMIVRFGILHFMGTAMIFYGVTRKLWEALPRWVTPVVSVLGTIFTASLAGGAAVEFRGLGWLGFTGPGYASSDYFPLLPWLFVFLFGTWLGWYIKEEKFPRWFYTVHVPVLGAVGRKSLWIYMLHQPVLYGLVMLGLRLFGR